MARGDEVEEFVTFERVDSGDEGEAEEHDADPVQRLILDKHAAREADAAGTSDVAGQQGGGVVGAAAASGKAQSRQRHTSNGSHAGEQQGADGAAADGDGDVEPGTVEADAAAQPSSKKKKKKKKKKAKGNADGAATDAAETPAASGKAHEGPGGTGGRAAVKAITAAAAATVATATTTATGAVAIAAAFTPNALVATLAVGRVMDDAAALPTPQGIHFVQDAAEIVTDMTLARLVRPPRYFDDDADRLNAMQATSSARCFNCGKRGHRAAACTFAARDKPCYLCAQIGHEARECPMQLCFKCGRPGHMVRNCPTLTASSWELGYGHCIRCASASCPCANKADYFRYEGGCQTLYSAQDLAQCRCYMCGRLGHLCCKEVSKEPAILSCYCCGSTDHLGEKCPWEDRVHIMTERAGDMREARRLRQQEYDSYAAYQQPQGYGGGGGGGGGGGRWVRGRYVDGDGSDPYGRRPAPHWRRQGRGRGEEGAAAGQQRWQQDGGGKGRKRDRSEYSRPWQADSDDHWAPEEDWEGDQGQGEGGHRGSDDRDGEDGEGEDVWARLSKKYKGGRRKAGEGEEAAPAAKKARRKKAG